MDKTPSALRYRVVRGSVVHGDAHRPLHTRRGWLLPAGPRLLFLCRAHGGDPAHHGGPVCFLARAATALVNTALRHSRHRVFIYAIDMFGEQRNSNGALKCVSSKHHGRCHSSYYLL